MPWKATRSPTKQTEQARPSEDALTARTRASQLAGDSARPKPILLADLLDYHRREAKPEWWAYFDRQKKSLDDLIDDTEAIAVPERRRRAIEPRDR